MKPAILILHGWNLNGDRFSPLVSELKQVGYENVIAIDLPGFGNAKRPTRPYYLSDYAEYVDNYIKRQKWKEVVLVGHSFGGRVGIKLASQRPLYLKTLFLTGTPGYNPVPKVKILFFLMLAKIGDILFTVPLLKQGKHFARKLLYKLARANDFYTTDIAMQDTFKNIVNENLEPYLPKIAVPTFLIWGEDDKITPLWIGKKMEKAIPNASLSIIPDARHGVPWTHAKEFTQIVNTFIQSR